VDTLLGETKCNNQIIAENGRQMLAYMYTIYRRREKTDVI
jgi:hypothetical protein